MKLILIVISLLVLSMLVYFIYLGFKSQSGQAPGLVNQQLSPCPASPNCICTEYASDNSHYTAPVEYAAEHAEIIQRAIESAIKAGGGEIISTQPDYLAATYRSSIFRYVDDFEVRIDNTSRLIHIRSASRVGRSDLGANLKRIETFKQLLSMQLAQKN